MDLTQLKAKCAVVSADLVKAPVTWTHKTPDGTEVTDEFDVFVRRVSFGVLERAGQEANRASALIAACVCFGKDGEEVMSYDEACALDPSLATQLVEAVNRVNKVDERMASDEEKT